MSLADTIYQRSLKLPDEAVREALDDLRQGISDNDAHKHFARRREVFKIDT